MPRNLTQERPHVGKHGLRKGDEQDLELESMHNMGQHEVEHQSLLQQSESPPRTSIDENIQDFRPLLSQDAERHSDSDSSENYRRRRNLRNPRTPLRLPASSPSSSQADAEYGNLDIHFDMEKKKSPIEPLTISTQAPHLMSRDQTVLDIGTAPPPLTPFVPRENPSFFGLPWQEKKNFLLLVLLYLIQGVPLGLVSGAMPVLLKPHLSYTQMGVFSLAIYPYSLKLAWSPLVDGVWSARIGRRKTWIMSMQMLCGIGMIMFGITVKDMMVAAGKDNGTGQVWIMTGVWIFLVFTDATQDIAVDGWGLTLLAPEILSYASTAHVIGVTTGSFISSTAFLALNSQDLANRWFRNTPHAEGLISLKTYMTFWGWMYILITVGIGFLKREKKCEAAEGIVEAYKSMLDILKLPSVQLLIFIHLIARIGFEANDTATTLKLLDKGFGQDNIALVQLIDFPFALAVGYYAGRFSTKYTPMHLWCWAFIGRLAGALLAQGTVMIYPKGNDVPFWYLAIVIVQDIFGTFTNITMFVTFLAFHVKISDPLVGGTYMTLLATYVSQSSFPTDTQTNTSIEQKTLGVHSLASSFSN